MSERARSFGVIWALGSVAAVGGWATNGVLVAADDSCLWGPRGSRTTYAAPYDPSDAPTIPLLKRSSVASGGGAQNGENAKNARASVGPRVGDSGTFVGADGKTYFYRFVEGVRRRAVVETRPDASSPSGWRKTTRYVDEPRLIKQIWPAEVFAASPEPCRPVENVVETSESADVIGINGTSGASNAATSGAAGKNEPAIIYRATVRAVVR